ncbi:uncharacterized protein BDV14DRAFT_200934 [Aspergillus stella-maris]|uniref:uncharacterized protein n=1 Tax=Aspergillus stella-maris TaxID=1810926 RepID=UPI003CCDB3DF
MSTPFLRTWHAHLSLPRISNRTWHLARLSEELAERAAANTRLSRLSETADILFTLSRASHDRVSICLRFHAFFTSNAHAAVHAHSHLDNQHIRYPPWSTSYDVLARFYMLGKFTSRWSFYQVAALCAGKREWRGVKEVVNPRKMSKVAEVAGRHGIVKEKFGRVCWWLLWVWPVLP